MDEVWDVGNEVRHQQGDGCPSCPAAAPGQSDPGGDQGDGQREQKQGPDQPMVRN